VDGPAARGGLLDADKGWRRHRIDGGSDLIGQRLLALFQLGLEVRARLCQVNPLDSSEDRLEGRIVGGARRVDDGLAFEHGVVEGGLAIVGLWSLLALGFRGRGDHARAFRGPAGAPVLCSEAFGGQTTLGLDPDIPDHAENAEDPLARSRVGRALRDKLRGGTAEIAVVGLGYVGLPLAVLLGHAGFRVHGIDADPERASLANAGSSYIGDVATSELAQLAKSGQFSAATTFEAASRADAILVCVPTPLRKSREPDISFVLSAFESLMPWLRRGQLLVLESTTYPGTTEDVLLPKIEEKGFTVGQDFFLAFSPERVDPGNASFTTATIPKVVGGVTRACTEMAAALYATCTAQVHRVSSPRVAETAKLLENTFRSVNIALANELALACRALGVNPWEVIAAAATKPFGFMPFYPGPGTGGHCVPLDPLYLSWTVRLKGFEPRFIALADEINRFMPRHAVTLVMDALNERGKCLQGAELLVLGVTYKRDVSDVRESPALEIMQMLASRGGRVSYADPFVSQLVVGDLKLASQPVTPDTLRRADCVVIATDHRAFDYPVIAREAPLVVDLRNALGHIRDHRDNIVTL